jgi:hypothetical protein
MFPTSATSHRFQSVVFDGFSEGAGSPRPGVRQSPPSIDQATIAANRAWRNRQR